MKASWQDMRFPRDDVALGHVKFEPGNDKMKRTALATAVLVKQNGRWLITAFHNTLLYGPPLPEQFPPNSKGGALDWLGHATLTSPSFFASAPTRSDSRPVDG